MSAAILNKFLEVLGISEEEDEDIDMEREYEEVEDTVTYERPARAGYFSKNEV